MTMAPQPATATSVLPAPLSDVRPRIVLADDSQTTREMITRILGIEFDIVELDNGARAWEQLTNDPETKAIITDIEMPELDGYQLIGRIRGCPEARIRDLPVVVVTAADDKETRRRAFLCGATGFVIKPVDSTQLQALMHAYVRHERTARELEQKAEKLSAQSAADALTGLRSLCYFTERAAQ